MPVVPGTTGLYEPPSHLGLSRLAWDGRLRKEPCFACGYRPTKRSGTIEHVQPRSAGGANDSTNIVGACSACNTRKGARSLLLFLLDTLAEDAGGRLDAEVQS